MSDFDNYLRAKARTELHQVDFRRARAELRIAQIEEHVAMLLGQAEPANSLGIDREALRAILEFVSRGDKTRLIERGAKGI